MTKRLFAIVLAAILAITMFTFPTFATGDVRATLTKDGTKLTLTFNKGSDVSANRVVLSFYVGNSTSPVKTETVTDMAKTSYDYSTTTGGVYHAQVVYYNGSQIITTAESGPQTIPITSSGTNMKVIYDDSGINLEFNAQSGATDYTAVYTYKSGNTTMNGQPVKLQYTTANGKATAKFDVGVSYSNLVSIKLYVGTPNSYSTTNFASWGNTSSTGGSTSSNNLYVGGNVTAEIRNGAIVGTINDYSFGVYRIGVAYGNSTNYQYSSPLPSKSFSVSLSNAYYGLNIVVEGSYSSYNAGTWQRIGMVSYNYGSTGSGSGNVSLNNYNGNLVLSWTPVSGASGYIINYQGNNITSGRQYVDANTTYWTVPFLSVTNSFTLNVVAQMSDGSYRDLGTTGSNYGSSYPYYPSYGQSSNGVVTQGNNCTVTSYSNYAYVQWLSTGARSYAIVVYREGDTSGSSQLVEGTTYAQIPISNAYNYRIEIYDNSNNYNYAPIATASVKAQASLNNLTSIKKTTIKNLKVTPLNSYTTSISWDKVSSANYYVAIYGLLSGGATEEVPVYRGDTSITIPFGSTTPYQVTVYSVDVNGRRSQVGYVYNVPGTTADNSSSKDYPAELTAKSLNKKIKLSWKEVDDASYYTIYYKRSTSSTWNKIDSRVTKTVVNISGLTNEIDYDFKVIPNKGSESGIVTIAPSTTSRTVTARDPSSTSGDGDVNLDEDELTVTSVSSTSKGKIKITWSNVGAPSYKIYVAEGNSNSYKACGTYTGTSATISTFGTGSKATSFKSGKTYKVRIVRTDYTGSIQTALKACPYKTVTVK